MWEIIKTHLKHSQKGSLRLNLEVIVCLREDNERSFYSLVTSRNELFPTKAAILMKAMKGEIEEGAFRMISLRIIVSVACGNTCKNNYSEVLSNLHNLLCTYKTHGNILWNNMFRKGNSNKVRSKNQKPIIFRLHKAQEYQLYCLQKEDMISWCVDVCIRDGKYSTSHNPWNWTVVSTPQRSVNTL